MWLLVEIAITKTKKRSIKMCYHAGHIGLSAHSSRKSFVMGEKASYFLGMKNTEQSTSRHCCISLIRRKQESNLVVSILSFKNCFFFWGAGPSSSRNIPKQLQQQEAGQKNQLFNRHKTQCQHVLIMSKFYRH